ncbi:MAG: SDR family NAD(P)-dependent oxidoreductase [Aerococcus sp.]|nr:SDR family NAD(P)-dependent oxidoreductase [Aerococcus sp.]
MKDWMVITGASSGIGASFSQKAARAGYPLLLTGRNEAHLKAVQATCQQLGSPQVDVLVADLLDVDAIDRLVKKATTNRHVFALVHCAGYGDFESIITQETTAIKAMLETNLLATMYLTKAFALKMLDDPEHEHNITMIASVAGKIHTPQSTVYSASKAGVWGYANSLRQDLMATNITVTCILPGPVKTPFFTRTAANRQYYEQVERTAVTPEHVALRMFNAIEAKRWEVVVPYYYEILAKLLALSPTLSYHLIHYFFRTFPVKRSL